jgi:hypothetical protein
LGDDVTIANSQVAEAYVELIKGLGMDISMAKSVVPTEGHNSIEFASKLIINGSNIRPLPLGLLLQGDSISILSLLSSTCKIFTEAGTQESL